MRFTLVYDWATRVFHWLFSSLFLLTFLIAKTQDDESSSFQYHMIFGLLMAVLVLWRIFWGVWGTDYAQFKNFVLSPSLLKEYFVGILAGTKKKWTGHNPASSWAAITMFLLSIGLAITGFLMSTTSKELFEDVHELMANSFIVIVVLHIAGLVLHSIRFQDNIGLSMVDGKKSLQGDEHKPITRDGKFAAVLLVAIFISSFIYINKNHDAQNARLNLFGKTLILGENEKDEVEKSDQENESHSRENQDEDGDDD